jgi:drug/metabolite transporter (DMT)-like permease
MKTAVILILAIVAQAIGNVYLTKGMKALNASGDATLLQTFIEGLTSPMLLIGTVLLIVFFILYSAALSWADLSFVLPATAFGYVLNVAAGHYFLREMVTPERWAGAAVITVGVVFVSRSGDRTTEASGDRRQVNAAGSGE